VSIGRENGGQLVDNAVQRGVHHIKQRILTLVTQFVHH